MIITGVPFTAVNWEEVTPVELQGDTGTAVAKTVEQGNIRVRMVEYGPNFSADHWCSRGHIVLMLEGSATMELEDGRTFEFGPGMSFHVADGIDAHRVYTRTGAKVFIVD